MSSPRSRALRTPTFRRLFLAHTISRWGDTFNTVALVVLVYQLTGSGLQVGATVILEITPVLLLGFVVGALVDRSSHRRVMIAADLGRAGLALALVLGHQHLWLVYTAAFGLSAFSVFFNPAAASILPGLVSKDDLVGANTALWSTAVVSQSVLAPLAGALVALAGPSPAFAVNAASFLISAALLARLPLPSTPQTVHGRALHDVADGLRLIRRSRLLSGLAIVQALAALSAGATSALLVVLAAEHLHAGPDQFGLLLGAIGIGAGLGPLLLQRLIDIDIRQRRYLFGPYLLRGAVDLTLAASSSFPVALTALTAYGVGTSTGMITYNSVVQATVADAYRGRVFAFYDVIWQAARLASIGLGGLLTDTLGVRVVYLLGGLLLIAAASIGPMLIPPSALMGTADTPSHPPAGSQTEEA